MTRRSPIVRENATSILVRSGVEVRLAGRDEVFVRRLASPTTMASAVFTIAPVDATYIDPNESYGGLWAARTCFRLASRAEADALQAFLDRVTPKKDTSA